MGNSPITETTAVPGLVPRRSELLADLQIDQSITAPLGGLNPYSPHFKTIGAHFRQLVIEHARLTPKQKLLDIGCGTGRLAAQMTDFFSDGAYHGFDVHPRFINYCHNTYHSKQMHFDHIDVKHDEYNPNGKLDPASLIFPYSDYTFDVVVAVAVFNHFRFHWIERYVQQIARVLKPRGVFFCTMLMINNYTIKSINKKVKPPYQFSHRTRESWHDFETRPLFNVAHPEELVRRAFIANNLIIRDPIRYGQWCGSEIALSGPDVIISRLGGWQK